MSLSHIWSSQLTDSEFKTEFYCVCIHVACCSKVFVQVFILEKISLPRIGSSSGISREAGIHVTQLKYAKQDRGQMGSDLW